MKIIVRHNDRNDEGYIQDLGKGISVKDRVQLFDLVFTGKLLGIGLGLTICRQMAKRQEGTIDLAGWTHLNMTFVIRLPRYPVDGQGRDHSCADWYDGLGLGGKLLVTVLRNAPEFPIQSQQGGKKNFLIVDDENNMQLKPAVFRIGFGCKAIGALWLLLPMWYGSLGGKKSTVKSC